jgi:hypothetical protein
VTTFGNLNDDKKGIKGHVMGPGEGAVGHWGPYNKIRGKDYTEIEQKQKDLMVVPFKSTVTIETTGRIREFLVTDYGAYDKEHPAYDPDEWFDVWDPIASGRGKSYDDSGGWMSILVLDNCPCPKGFSENKQMEEEAELNEDKSKKFWSEPIKLTTN